jgi:hypothetical protein
LLVWICLVSLQSKQSNMEQTQKTHWKLLQNSDYIGAYTLQDGKDNELTVTIQKVSREKVTGADGKEEQCTVCHLVGQKPMILNATNQKTMAKLFASPYIEDWAGKKMTLYVAKVKAFGDTVDALRVRPTVPKLPELTATHPKWEGAKVALKAGNTTIEAIRKSFILSIDNEKLLSA